MTTLDAVREEIEKGPQCVIPDENSDGPYLRYESSREFATRIAAMVAMECAKVCHRADNERQILNLATALQGERTQEKI